MSPSHRKVKLKSAKAKSTDVGEGCRAKNWPMHPSGHWRSGPPPLRGGLFFWHVWRKKIITNSYFIPFFMFICQNVGNLKGFLLVYLHELYLITLSSYSSTGEAPHHSNKILNKIKYLSIQLLIRGTCRGATEGLTVHSEFPYLTSLFF